MSDPRGNKGWVKALLKKLRHVEQLKIQQK